MVKIADDSELDYIADFLRKVHTTYTVATIETTRNIHTIDDTQAILLYAGESISSSGNILKRQYKLQYKDASEGVLNASFYALIEGIRKLNAREAITSYTRNTSLVGMQFVSSGLDYHQMTAGNWYANIKIIVKWIVV